jgi:hypothetical protein
MMMGWAERKRGWREGGGWLWMEVSLIIYLGFGVAGGVLATCSFFY